MTGIPVALSSPLAVRASLLLLAVVIAASAAMLAWSERFVPLPNQLGVDGALVWDRWHDQVCIMGYPDPLKTVCPDD